MVDLARLGVIWHCKRLILGHAKLSASQPRHPAKMMLPDGKKYPQIMKLRAGQHLLCFVPGGMTLPIDHLP